MPGVGAVDDFVRAVGRPGGAGGPFGAGGPVGTGDTALSGGVGGAEALGPLLDTVLNALAEGARRRGGPIAAGRPGEMAEAVAEAFGEGAGVSFPHPAPSRNQGLRPWTP
ncbi:hypothetical protein AB0H70_30250, partial [Streptomyces sp. NPDC050804]